TDVNSSSGHVRTYVRIPPPLGAPLSSTSVAGGDRSGGPVVQASGVTVVDHRGDDQAQQQGTYRHGDEPGPGALTGGPDTDTDDSTADAGTEEGQQEDVHRREDDEGGVVEQGDDLLLRGRTGADDPQTVGGPGEHEGQQPVQGQAGQAAHDPGHRTAPALG